MFLNYLKNIGTYINLQNQTSVLYGGKFVLIKIIEFNNTLKKQIYSKMDRNLTKLKKIKGVNIIKRNK